MASDGDAERSRYRTADGSVVPGVTTVISNLGFSTRGLMYWGFKCGVAAGLEAGLAGKRECDTKLDDVREGLADAGKLAHLFAQHDIQGKPRPPTTGIAPEIIAKAEDSFGSYLAWKERTRLELVASEVQLVSEKHRYGGRVDGVIRFGEAFGILDFKSSKELYPDAIVQVAAYGEAWTENNPDLPITEWHVLRWGPDGSFTHHALSQAQIAAAWRIFRHALAVHELKKGLKA